MVALLATRQPLHLFGSRTATALHTGRPPYLSDLLQYHELTRSLRSSNSHQLSVPRHNLSLGSRAFRFSAPRVLFTTCQHPRISSHFVQTSSKDILLSVSLPHFSCPPCLEYLCPRALILLRLYKSCTYLLTYLRVFALQFYCSSSFNLLTPINCGPLHPPEYSLSSRDTCPGWPRN